MRKPTLIAVCISDLHLTLTRPSCREEEDWLAVQRRYLLQVKQFARYGFADQVPILCAGDIFDRWNAMPELIHFALDALPDGMVCVPGQHDLPNHRIDLMHRSGYGVLKAAGKIVDTSGGMTFMSPGLTFTVTGFGWDEPIHTIGEDNRITRVALIHRYVWKKGKSYPGAPPQAHVAAFGKELEGYHVAVFGDNHQGFLARTEEGTRVLNCGGFLRRKSDEKEYVPAAGLLYSDGSVDRVRYDTEEDRFTSPTAPVANPIINIQSFIQELEKIGEQGLDFEEAVNRFLRGEEDLKPRTKELILRSLGR